MPAETSGETEMTHQSGALLPDPGRDEDFENDSAINDLATENSTAMPPLAASIRRYRIENGRTYHAYKDGSYVLPNDEIENDRLDLQHHVWLLFFKGALGACPAIHSKGAKVGRVLDVGTGTGIWCMDFGDEHPEAEVFGVDLSPIQPAFVPPNVRFEIDDLEQPWTFTQKFDFINVRSMTGSFTSWPNLFRQCYDNLNPGGWIEVDDSYLPLKCDDNTLTPEHALYQWGQYYVEAGATIGKHMDETPKHPGYLAAAGFTNIKVEVKKWASNTWPANRQDREIGMWMRENIAGPGGIEGISMALFTRVLGWSKEQVQIFSANVRADMRNRAIHSYWEVFVIYAQKPL